MVCNPVLNIWTHVRTPAPRLDVSSWPDGTWACVLLELLELTS